MNEVAILLYGLFVGARHALEPDHLAAVSTMASHGRSLRDTSRITIAWGLGHTSLIAVIGVAFIALNLQLPAWLQASGEGLVGLMMVLMGAHVLWRMRLTKFHIHRHAHDGHPGDTPHSHFHVHQRDTGHRHSGDVAWMRRPWAAYLTGSVHGLAGSGAAIALAVAAAPSAKVALLYLLVFGVGSVAGMALLGVLAMWPLVMLSSRAVWARQAVQGLAGSASVFLGAMLLLESWG